MTNHHPYEFGGILFTIAVLGGLLGGMAYNEMSTPDEYVNKEMIKQPLKTSSPPPSSDWSDYYKNNDIGTQQCKQAAFDLQDYFDCVND